jgi:tetratricopeptide (TPR) repeat protein
MKKLALVLGSVVAAACLLLALDLFWESTQWTRYVEVPAPPRDLSQQEKSLREKLNFYEKSADEQKTLASLILGLSTLYGLALGIGAYVDMKESRDRADKIFDQITEKRRENEKRFGDEIARSREAFEKVRLDFRREFPLFSDTQSAIGNIRAMLSHYIPEVEYGKENLLKLQHDGRRRVMIEYFEHSVAAFEFFSLEPFREDATMIYSMLGSHYSHQFAREREEGKVQPVKESIDVAKARFYLERARKIGPAEIVPLNEMAFLQVIVLGEAEEARPILKKSLELRPKQQRANYYLSIVEHMAGTKNQAEREFSEARASYQESVRLLTEAIVLEDWQASHKDDHHADKVKDLEIYRRAFYYNRACAKARLAELEGDEAARNKLSWEAVDDLKKTFPVDKKADPRREKDFQKDVLDKTGDLYQLAQREEVKKEVQGILNWVQRP